MNEVNRILKEFSRAEVPHRTYSDDDGMCIIIGAVTFSFDKNGNFVSIMSTDQVFGCDHEFRGEKGKF